MSKNLLGWAVVTTLSLSVSAVPFPATANAHARLDYPPGRDMRDDHKDSTGGAPCGVTRTAAQPSTRLAPGASIDVKWTETVDHPGCFLVDFSSAGDLNFQLLANVKHLASGDTPRPYTQTITLPPTPCSGCTVRVRQIMLGSETDTCPPATIPRDVTYYACGNVQLSDGPPDAAVPAADGPGPPDGNDTKPNSSNGCDCSLGESAGGTLPATGMAIAGIFLALALRRPRHRSLTNTPPRKPSRRIP